MKRVISLTLSSILVLYSPVLAQEGERVRPTLMPTGGFVLFYGGSGPMSYITPTPRDVPKGARMLGEVQGEGCQWGIFIPLQLSLRPEGVSSVFGNAGFVKALGEIRQKHPDLDGLFDMKIDRHTFSILSIYNRACTEVIARGFSY